MSPPGVASPAGGERAARPASPRQPAPPCPPAPRPLLAAPVVPLHAPRLPLQLAPGHCSSLPRNPPHLGAGPSSPRGAWPHGRGSIAEAAANALMKGSPRGVTPTHSAAALGAAADKAAAAAAGVAAVQAKLQKLTVRRFKGKREGGGEGLGAHAAPGAAAGQAGMHNAPPRCTACAHRPAPSCCAAPAAGAAAGHDGSGAGPRALWHHPQPGCVQRDTAGGCRRAGCGECWCRSCDPGRARALPPCAGCARHRCSVLPFAASKRLCAALRRQQQPLRLPCPPQACTAWTQWASSCRPPP